jgi:hypothetical protein
MVIGGRDPHHARHGAIPPRAALQRGHEEARTVAALVSVRELHHGTPLLGPTHLLPGLRSLPLGGRDQTSSAHTGLTASGPFGWGRWPARTVRQAGLSALGWPGQLQPKAHFAWKAATPGRSRGSRLPPMRRIVGLIAHNLARVAERET